jgi:urea transporter
VHSITTGWDAATERNALVRFIDTLFRGAGQVMLQANPLTGLLFIAGITWGAIDAEMPEVAAGAVVALTVSTATAMMLDADEASLRMGLYGFNGILVGAAVPTFLDADALVWVYVVVGAAVSTVAMLAIANVFKTWGVPALTFPFVLTTWFLLLGAYAFANVEDGSLAAPALPVDTAESAAHVDVTTSVIIETVFRNVSQVFLINNVATGVIFVVALLVSSRWSALFALIGSSLALATALLLGATDTSVTAGLFGFSAVLTAIALGSVFYTPGAKVVVYTLLAVIFTVIVQGALDTALTPIGIPTLTAPFVFVTWLFLIPKEKFVPIAHQPMKSGAAGSAHPATVVPGAGRSREVRE